VRRVFLIGVLIWIVGTIGVRLLGQRVLQPDQASRTVLVYLASFVLMALLVRCIFRRLRLERDAWFEAATLLILPTLILDPFSCLFFALVFPNMDAAVAGAFGGWMLICCGGGIAGLWAKR
jgi:hypothetical protein